MTRHTKALTLLLAALGVYAGGNGGDGGSGGSGGGGDGGSGSSSASLCPTQPPPLSVGADWDPAAEAGYADKAAQRLSRAIQIPTVSSDAMSLDPNDPVFDVHKDFAKFLEQEFPSVYANTRHEFVNVHSHLFTWGVGATADQSTGGNATAPAGRRDLDKLFARQDAATQGGGGGQKPILLMSHSDVVPVLEATAAGWTFPGFAGQVATDATPATPGVWVFGRGASDTKNTLMGVLAAMEKLIGEGYTPSRPVLFSIGYDEEVGGLRGAVKIAEVLEERYGKNGVAFLIDEGSGIRDVYGHRVASLGMAEKGYLSLRLSVSTPGGHSSEPLPHTGIGYMARFVARLEDNPYPNKLDENNPFLWFLSCLAEHVEGMPADLRAQVLDSAQWPALAEALGREDRAAAAFLHTTMAIDIINGGNKINSLPESVNVSINHRMLWGSTQEETTQHYVNTLLEYAQGTGFEVDAFGTEYGLAANMTPGTPGPSELTGGYGPPVPAGKLTMGFIESDPPLDSAPITPSDGEAFKFVAGTVKGVWGDDTLVSPAGLAGNTDTGYMWNVTDNIFRFSCSARPSTCTPSTSVSASTHT